MALVSWLGNQPQMFLLITAIVLTLFTLKFRRESVWLAISGLGSYILSSSLKVFVHEPRPPFSHSLDWSFPSGHVLSFIACFGFLAYLARRRPVILSVFLALIILVGPSRVYLGEHWPGDVLGSYFLGSLWLFLIIRLYNKRI